MNYFLIVVILALCGGGYYEYTVLEQKSAADQQQITDLGAKVDPLESENKKLADDKTRLTKSVNDAQAEIVNLTSQVQAAQSALAEARQQALQAENGGQPTPTTGAALHPTNNLGTITTLDGKIFQNCHLLKVEARDIVVENPDGITQILYGSMTPDLQRRFGYDPHNAGALTEAQIRYQEQLRKAAEDAGVPEQAVAP
jgi:hypothetical protein